MCKNTESPNVRSGMSISNNTFARVIALLCALLCARASAALTVCVAPPIDRARLPAELSTLTDEEIARIAKMSPRAPLAADPTNRVADDVRAAHLGHALFFDTRLSPAGISCATCHDPAHAFTDQRALARGVAVARRNAPSVIDAARRRWLGWDGKFDSLWSQALSPLENPVEMGGDRTTLVRIVRDDPSLCASYESIFGAMPATLGRSLDAVGSPRDQSRDQSHDQLHDQLHDPLREPARPLPRAGSALEQEKAHERRWNELDTPTRDAINLVAVNILKCFGAYQRLLISEAAPIDSFVAALKGSTIDASATDARAANLDALNPSARRGLALFVSRAGCTQCHRGANFTDDEFHNIGLVGANGRVPDDRARLDAIEFVKSNPFNAAGVFSDAPDAAMGEMVRALRRSPELFGQFRTPSLRGVAQTPPYMHDGRFATLADVVHFYDTLQGSAPLGHHGESVLVQLQLSETERADLIAFLSSLSTTPTSSPWFRSSMAPLPASPKHEATDQTTDKTIERLRIK